MKNLMSEFLRHYPWIIDLSVSFTTQSGCSGIPRALVYLKPSAFFPVLSVGQQSLLSNHYGWEKGLLWSWCNDFRVNNHQKKSDHCRMFLGLSSTNKEDFTLLFNDGLWFDKRGAELLHKCGTVPWQSNKCFGKDPMISKNWPPIPSLSRTNIKILFSGCF